MSLLDSLVSYWRLDEASDTRNDAHGSNHLSPTNTPGNAEGRKGFGNALSLVRASSQSLSVAVDGLQSGDFDFTIACWAKLASKPGAGTEMTICTSDYPGYILRYGNDVDRFQFLLGDAAATANNLGSPSIGIWYFIVAWHDEVANKLYISVNNGAADSNTQAGSTVGGVNFRIGQRSGLHFWDGDIDELGFWTRILTENERIRLYRNGAGLTYPFAEPPHKNALRPRSFAPGLAR